MYTMLCETKDAEQRLELDEMLARTPEEWAVAMQEEREDRMQLLRDVGEVG